MSSQIKNIYIILIISLIVTFSFYKNITLSTFPAGDLWFNKYIETSRHKPSQSVLTEQTDLFIAKQFSQNLQTAFTPYSYKNLPGYIFYKVFHLRGESLWLAQKFFTSLLNVGCILLVFGIANSLFGNKIALFSAILCAFSPHIWVTFNFSIAGARAYNYFFSLSTIFLFLNYKQKKTLFYLVASGVVMGVNFLFFHIGSFSIPIIIATYCFFLSLTEKRFSHTLNFIKIFIIGLVAAIIFGFIHLTYFRIDQSPFFTWIDWYKQRGLIASHNLEGLVFFDIHRLSDNIGYFFDSVFINGLDQDWHYIIAPPGIPLIYSYFIFAFSIPGAYVLFRKKRKENLFLICWLLFFILVYSLIIVVRIKNMLLLIPPFIILSTLGVRLSATYLHRTSHKWLPLNLYFKLILNHKFSRKRFEEILAGILLGGSVLIGGYFTFVELPSKNFYNGGGHLKYREVYRHITNKGYSKNSSIVFTSSESLALPNLALRLLTKNVPRFVNLSSEGLPSPYEVDAKLKFIKIDSNLKSTNDKIYYCFIFYHNYLGNVYVTDNVYEELFLDLYPDATPFVINGLDGMSLWKIYRVAGDHQKS